MCGMKMNNDKMHVSIFFCIIFCSKRTTIKIKIKFPGKNYANFIIRKRGFP